MRIRGPLPEAYLPGAGFFYGYVGYCVFFPEQEFRLSKKHSEDICADGGKECGSRCGASEDKIGEVNVSAERACDYKLAHLRVEFEERGLLPCDVVSNIEHYYPVGHPAGLAELVGNGIGGSVLNEVVDDCRRLGSAAVFCSTLEPEMRGMLRNKRFGFEEIGGYRGEFIRVFR